MRPKREALAVWLRALQDMDVESLCVPPGRRDGAEAPPPDPPVSENDAAPGGPAPSGDLFAPDQETPARPAPAGGGKMSGVFPAMLQVLSEPGLEPLKDPPPGERGLAVVREVLGECTRCGLHAGRTNLVFGVGSPEAEIVFVGEGPGRDEDIQGEPFVGRAGKLLDQMIRSMGYERSEVYIANVVKCRPPENRTPAQDEADACSPFLHAQIAAIRPRVLIALGLPATQALLGKGKSMGAMRGRFHDYRGVPVMPTYHPAYLLRSPGQKVKVAHDLALVIRLLGRDLPAWAAKALREEAP